MLLAFATIILITIVQFIVTVLAVIGKDEMSAAYDEAKAALAGNVILFAGIVVIVMLVYFAILYFSSGWFTRMFARRLAATGKI